MILQINFNGFCGRAMAQAVLYKNSNKSKYTKATKYCAQSSHLVINSNLS